MPKKTLRTMALITAGALAAAGCSAGNNGSGNSNSDKSKVDSGQAVATPAGPLQLSILAKLHQPQVPKDTVIKQIGEMTNAKLDIQWSPAETFRDKLSTSIATNSLPKAVLVSSTELPLLKNAIRSGMFWEVGPLLKDYKNLKNLNPAILENTKINGKIYSLYTDASLSRQGVILRKDWLDKLGLQPPKTIDELYQVFKKFTENDPDGNGAKDTFGLADRNDLIYGAFKTLGSYFGVPNYWGAQDGKLVPEFMTKEYMDTMNFMNKLYEEKLINTEFAVTSKDQQITMFTQGKAGAYIGAMKDGVGMEKNAKKLNPNASFELINRIQGPKGHRVWSLPGYGSLYLFPKSVVKSEAELKQILAFFDRTLDSDVGNLWEYGIEGRHFDLKDGVAHVKTENEAKQLIDQELLPLQALQPAQASVANLKPRHNNDPLDQKADKLIEDNNSILVHNPAAAFDSETMDQKGSELKKIIDDATYKYIMGKIDAKGFQGEVDRWKKSGGEQIMKDYNDQFAAKAK